MKYYCKITFTAVSSFWRPTRPSFTKPTRRLLSRIELIVASSKDVAGRRGLVVCMGFVRAMRIDDGDAVRQPAVPYLKFEMTFFFEVTKIQLLLCPHLCPHLCPSPLPPHLIHTLSDHNSAPSCVRHTFAQPTIMSFQPGIRTRRRSAAALGFLGPIALLFLASASVQLRSAFLLPATGEAAANTGGGEYDGYADSPRRMRRREGGDGEADDEDDDEGDQGGRGVTTTMRASPSTGQIADARRRRRLPRIVVVEYPDGSNGTLSVRPLLPIDGVGYDENRSSSFEFATDSIPTNCPGEVCALVTPSWHEPNALDYIDEDTDACEPMADWQLGAYPNCNSFHEVDMRRLRVINSGGSRTAFEMAGVSADGTGMKFVYKTIKFRKDVTASKIDEQRKDSLIMERTTKSMFIPDIHGYCSLAVMMDFMPEGEWSFWRRRRKILSIGVVFVCCWCGFLGRIYSSFLLPRFVQLLSSPPPPQPISAHAPPPPIKNKRR